MQHDDEPNLTRRDAEMFRAALRTAARSAGVLPAAEAPPKPTKRTCSTCAHWHTLQGSPTGGQCVKGKARDCRPLTNAYHYWTPKGTA